MTVDDIYLQIDQKFPTLPKQLRTAARFIREHPERVALDSVRAVAEQAKTHPSNVMRLVRLLGFAKYSEFRAPFKQRLSTPRTSITERVEALWRRGQTGYGANILSDTFAGEIENLRITLEQVTMAEVAKAAELIVSARRVFIVGLRSLYPAAFLLDYSFKFFMPKTALVEGRGGTLTDEVRGIGPADVLVVMTHRRYAQDTLKVAKFASEAGARLISLVDSPLAPTVAISEISLIVHPKNGAMVLASSVPALAMVQTLVAAVAVAVGNQAAALDKSEAQFKFFDVFSE